MNIKVKTTASSNTIELQKKKSAYLTPFDSCIHFCSMIYKHFTRISQKLCDDVNECEHVDDDNSEYESDDDSDYQIDITDEKEEEDIIDTSYVDLPTSKKSVKPKRLLDSKTIYSLLQKVQPWEKVHDKSEMLDLLWRHVPEVKGQFEKEILDLHNESKCGQSDNEKVRAHNISMCYETRFAQNLTFIFLSSANTEQRFA